MSVQLMGMRDVYVIGLVVPVEVKKYFTLRSGFFSKPTLTTLFHTRN
jgi:hypothetical protein